jgi:hypothetical protein
MPIAVIYIAAGLLFLGAAWEYLPYLPYVYFTVLKIVATGTFIWAFLVSFSRKSSLLPWIYLLFAIIFIPILILPLTQDLWTIIYITGGALLLLTIDKIKRKSPRKLF